MEYQNVKIIKTTAEKVKPFLEAVAKKQEFKNKVQKGEIKLSGSKGKKFV